MIGTHCYVALGGNLGDVVATMESGLNRLDGVPGVRVMRVSPVYQTVPVGPESETFLNAAAELACELSVSELLREIQTVENQFGRKRDRRWGPRALDLDILFYGDSVICEPRLTVPHPHLWYRRFVLDPLNAIAPNAMHPVFGNTIQELRKRLLRRPLPVMLRGGDPHKRRSLWSALQNRFPAITLGVETDCQPDELVILDLTPTADASVAEPPTTRVDDTIGIARERRVRLDALPGSPVEAAESVLTAALDCPAPYSRPLRRMP